MSATFQSILMASRGLISADKNLNYNLDLQVQWDDIYFQIIDQYESRGLCGVRIVAKNIEDHIVSGRADLSKSVILSRVSAHKACYNTFKNYSRTVLQVPSHKWKIPGPRLLVAGSYDTYIGWANFDAETHSSINGDEDSRYFLAVYAQQDHNNDYFILSLQVRANQPFLTEPKYQNDSFTYHSVSHKRNLQMIDIAK